MKATNKESGLTADRLKELFRYDQETGTLTRNGPCRGPAKAAGEAGTVTGCGYRVVMLDGRSYYAHQLAWLYTYGVWPEGRVEHINGVRDDDRIANLREKVLVRNEPYLTADRLRDILDYSPTTGVFTWKAGGAGTGGPGSVAGCVNDKGYVTIKLLGRTRNAHRLAWLYVYGKFPNDQIDHLNGIRNDNRILNLREATQSQNNCNLRLARSDSNTGLLGAHWHKRTKKFAAQIQVKGKKEHLGYFNTAEEAHQAYLAAKRELHSHCAI